jgi:hypothetical protein
MGQNVVEAVPISESFFIDGRSVAVQRSIGKVIVPIGHSPINIGLRLSPADARNLARLMLRQADAIDAAHVHQRGRTMRFLFYGTLTMCIGFSLAIIALVYVP